MRTVIFIPIVVIAVLAVTGVYTLQSKGVNKPAQESALTFQQAPASDIQELTLTNIDTGLPSGGKATFNQKTKTFSWTPTCGDSGRYRVKFTATDGKRTHEEVITITVGEACGPNEP